MTNKCFKKISKTKVKAYKNTDTNILVHFSMKEWCLSGTLHLPHWLPTATLSAPGRRWFWTAIWLIEQVKPLISLAMAELCVSMLSANKHGSYRVGKATPEQDPANKQLDTGWLSSLHFYYLYYMALHHCQMCNPEHHTKLRKQTEMNSGHVNINAI